MKPLLPFRLLTLVGLLAACGDDDKQSAPLDGPCEVGDSSCQEITNCEPLKAYCDIRKASCQKEVFRVTACERGQTVARAPKVRVITRAQLKKEVAADSGDSTTSAQGKAWERASQLLGFLPADQSQDMASDDEFVDGVAAYYSSKTKDVTVISDAAEKNDEGTFTLSHEFVHALQDQRDSFDDLYKKYLTSTDSMIALDSLFEGEATLLSNFVMIRKEGGDPKKEELGPYFDDMLATILKAIDESPAPLISVADLLVYPVGGGGLANLYQADGLEGIESLYDAPYTVLSRWLVEDPRLPKVLDCQPPMPPEGHEIVIGDRLGAGGLLALDVVAGSGTDLFLQNPERWKADQLAIYASGGDAVSNVALAWRIRLSSEAKAQALSDALQGMASRHLSVDLQGQEILIAASEKASVLEGWTDLGECHEAGSTKDRPLEVPLAASRLRRRLGLTF